MAKYSDHVGQVEVACTVDARKWTDIPTPLGPDIQVRWDGHVGSPDATGPAMVRLEWRAKPSIEELEAQGITREESDLS